MDDRPDPSGEAPLLLAVDGDGLLHRAFHGMGGAAAGGHPGGAGDRDRDGRPVWALRGLVGFVAAAAARLRPDALLVGLDSRVDPVRKALFADYKGHRPPHPPELLEQLGAAPGLLTDAGVPFVCAAGFEADDVLASAAALARREGWRTVLLTSDRDSFALLDETTAVLRLMAGGVEDSPMVTPDALARSHGVTPGQYRDLAALRGDPSDNLRGVPGIGSKIAARLLAAYGRVEEAYAAIDAGRLQEVAAVVGVAAAASLATPEARAAVARNRRLMAMVADLALPGPQQLRLPLDPERLRIALRARGIGLGPCLWALVGGEPPAWEPNGYDKAPRHLPSLATTPWALPPMPSVDELAAARAAASGQPLGQPPARWAARSRRRPGPARPVPAGQLSLF